MRSFVHGLFISGLLLAAMILAGCDTVPSQQNYNYYPGQETNTNTNTGVARFRVGETVDVTLTTGSPSDDIPPHEEPIKDDGTITMPLIGKVIAVGKTPGELQNDIYALYVPKYYVQLTVTVKSPPNDRVYYVGGQVNHPGVQVYLGDTTVTKAIQAAGDFNNFASHTVTLTRSTGERITVNVDRALAGKDRDPHVYPNDQIDVKRTIF